MLVLRLQEINLKLLHNLHDAVEDLDAKIEDTGDKNGYTLLPDINNIDVIGRSDEEGDIDITVMANQAAV